jgi:hypothetical protein
MAESSANDADSMGRDWRRFRSELVRKRLIEDRDLADMRKPGQRVDGEGWAERLALQRQEIFTRKEAADVMAGPTEP